VEGDLVIFMAEFRYIFTVGPRYRALVFPIDRTIGLDAQVGGPVRPSEDEPLQAEWYRGGLESPSSLALRDDGLFALSGGLIS
jgi:hypothetical protein